MNVRKLGTSMVAVGSFAAVAGLGARALQVAHDRTVLDRNGALDLSCLACAVFFGGLALVALGASLLVLGPRLYDEHDHRVVAERRLLQVAVPALVVGLVVASAAAIANSPLGEGTDTPATSLIAAESSNANTAPAGHAHDHSAAAAAGATATAADPESQPHSHGPVIPGTATGDSPCEIASPTPASPGQIGAGTGGSQGNAESEHGTRGMLVQKTLSASERVALEGQMRAARTVVDKFPTVVSAEAAGYHKSTPYVPCIGAHYTNVSKVGQFDPAQPSELLYDGTNPDSKIVGLSYLVLHPGGAPAGFAGPNDNWHQHNANGGLCLKGGLVVGGEDSTKAECEARGGRKTVLTDIWMVHAWVVPGFECSWGVFSGECPELGGKLGGTAWDN
jgi:hypothetical protein